MRKLVLAVLALTAVAALGLLGTRLLRPAVEPSVAIPTPAPEPAKLATRADSPACSPIKAPPAFAWRLPITPGSAAGTLLACEPLLGDMAVALRDADFILIGETHDNADHHRAQAFLIGSLAARPAKPMVVMEQITTAEMTALRELYRDTENYPPKSAALGEALRFEERGWPDWQTYAPIAEATHRLGGRLAAGDAQPGFYRTLGKQGEASLSAVERGRLGLDRPLSQHLQAALVTELKDDHCGLLPETAIPRMQLVQRARDANLADAMVQASAPGPVVLIAGNGHARTDRGVPWYLRVRAPGKRIVSVALIEDDPNATLAALVPRAPDEAPAADFVWLTPRAERKDPCETMRRQMGKAQ